MFHNSILGNRYRHIVTMFFVQASFIMFFCCGWVTALSVVRGVNDTDVLEGETFLLSCELKDIESRRIIWYHEESKSVLTAGRQLRRSIDLNRRRRYSVQGDPASEDFNLLVRHAQLRDTGIYVCAYEESGRMTPLSQGRLTVFPLPDATSPTCHASYDAPSTDNDRGYVDLKCSWKGPAGIDFTGEWYRNGVVVKEQIHSTSAVSHRRHMVDDDDNDVTFTCLISSPYSESWRRSCSVIPLQGSGEAIISIEPSVPNVVIGNNATYNCTAVGAKSVTWSLDAPSAVRFMSSGRFEVRDSVLILRDLQEADNFTKIICSAALLGGSHVSISKTLLLYTEFALLSKLRARSNTKKPAGIAKSPLKLFWLPFLVACVIGLLVLFSLLFAFTNRGKRNDTKSAAAATKSIKTVQSAQVDVDIQNGKSTEGVYQSIPKEEEDAGGLKGVSEDADKDDNDLSSDYQYVLDIRKFVGKPGRILPHYAKPNKSKDSMTTREKTISIGSDGCISFYENVSKHSSLASQMSKNSVCLPELDSESIYEAPPEVQIKAIKPGKRCSPKDAKGEGKQRYVVYDQIVERKPEPSGKNPHLHKDNETSQIEAPIYEVIDDFKRP